MMNTELENALHYNGKNKGVFYIKSDIKGTLMNKFDNFYNFLLSWSLHLLYYFRWSFR